MEITVLAVGAATFLLAGFVKGTIGLGLPTVAMGLLGLVMPPAAAAAVLVVPSLVTNAWQMLAGGALAPLLRRLWPMLLGVVAGTLAGSRTVGLAGPWAAAGLGAALAAYGLVGLARLRLPRPTAAQEAWLAPLVGVATGLVTAATGVFVLPAVPWLQALGLGKDDLVQALGLSFTVSTVALGAGLLLERLYDPGLALLSLAALGPAAVGMAIGQAVRARVSEPVFRTAFLAGLALLGLWLMLRTLS
ncbi:sulfite exporter TauE/SafE family protein [Rhodoplanes sp. TEM]|uniref:Probable membrane transporter protein n=1 Tax=Rhodoplanes tepidamans TaxID=200616 RepID=A0ABT5J7T9_RHOTP|nr:MULTISPECIES: sulfite exporter TauE/SafE family protein [Rhodoplanes]MDC7785542.1 sulfite exporter TauE/SafE family protein [Rhodoplanes tepidamans]MDC7986176.1 sulfite exporter TauE/SafE family protein [Rhodoplanes sp. TEM]MDQ0353288.1 putative membrane protein YfcA [Rhodoplanes tepidamans]